MSDYKFSFRAIRIYEDVMNAVQQAEELSADLSLEEYAMLMMTISNELNDRTHNAVMRIAEGE
jgi:hypothetical protein